MQRVFAGLLLCAAALPAEAADRPNIIVILADDFGYGSLGCYGGTGLRTPNLDRLAKEGRRFTHAYTNGSVCSPTRYGLMTGRYFWRTSVKDGEVLPGNGPLHIETNRMTLASLCKSKGYRTAAFGKWHLGMTNGTVNDWSVTLKPGPLEIGFDHFFGMGSNPWSGPHAFIEDHHVSGRIPGKPITVTRGREDGKTSGIERPFQYEHITEILTDHAVQWMSKKSEQPFLVYFAHTAVHRPVAPNPQYRGLSKYGIYGDFIEELDGSVGRLLEALDRNKLTDNTLVIFTSDNGGVIADTNEHAVAQKAGLKINGNLRGGKHDIWEGGFRVPFLVRWPGKVPANTVSEQVLCVTDVLPTLAGLLEVKLTEGQAEDGFDAREAFFAASPTKPVRDHVILQDARATYAIRSGNWKLVERENPPPFKPRNKNSQAKLEAARRKAPKTDELFDLSKDPSESTNVAKHNPEVVAKLRKLLTEARDRGRTR